MRQTLSESNVLCYFAVAIDACDQVGLKNSEGIEALRNDAFSFLLEAFMPVSRASSSGTDNAKKLLRKCTLQLLR